MLDNVNKRKFKFTYHGEQGLPESYPVPEIEGLLFYIQRNLNQNTVVYVLNQNADGMLNEDYPMDVYWVRYNSGGQLKSLNLIQDKLAFGYRSWKINNKSYKFQMVSYEQQDFYIGLDKNGKYKVYTSLEGDMNAVSNIYVYAEEFGVFPQVKYIEFYGHRLSDNIPAYKKVFL